MTNLQTFVMGLFCTSTLISLATEAVKKMLTEHGKSYHANTLAGLISFIVSLAIGVGYVVVMRIDFNASTVVSIVTFIFMSWLCAMVGYDKVVQTLGQLKNDKEDMNDA